MRDLGIRLKQAREERSISLKDIAARTKISVTALEALERGDFSRLPGGIFGRAFVRAYAAEIGLEPDAIVVEFQTLLDEHERQEAARGAERPEVTADDREFLERQRRALRVARAVAIGVIALLGVGLVWGLSPLWHRARVIGTTPAAVPAVAPPPAAAPTTPAPALEPAAGASEAQETAAASSAAGLTVTFTVTRSCLVWTSADGAVPTSRVFRPGDEQRIEAHDVISLDVGDAGAFQWTIDGKPGRALGAAGARVQARITKATVQEYLAR